MLRNTHRWSECLAALESLGLAHNMDTLVHFTRRLLTHRSLLVSFGPETSIIILIISKEILLLLSEWLRPDKAGTDPNLQPELSLSHLQGQAQLSPGFSRHFQNLECSFRSVLGGWERAGNTVITKLLAEPSSMDTKGDLLFN